MVALVLLSPVLAACKDDSKPAWEREGHISRSSFWEYHDRIDEPLCPTLLDLLDEHARTVGGKLGLTVEASRPLRYYRFKDPADLAAGCSAGVPACASKDAVLSQQPFDAHEQVHAYVSRAWGVESVGLVQEGEAVALSCDPPAALGGATPRDALHAGDWRQFLYLSGNSASGYVAAGYWVTYLARKYGWPKLAELHRRALPGLSADDFAIEFARVFPMSMEQAWSEALGGSSPPCDSGWICRTTRMSPGDFAQPDCDGELHRSIEVSGQPGVVLAHRYSMVLQNCADAAAPLYDLRAGKTGATNWATLPAGAYTSPRAEGTSSEFTFVAYLPSPFLASSCAQAGTVTLQSSQMTLVDLLPGTIDGCLRLDGGGRQYSVGSLRMAFPATGSAAVCASGDANADCVALPATLPIGGSAVLRLQHAEAAPSPADGMGSLIFAPATPVDGGS